MADGAERTAWIQSEWERFVASPDLRANLGVPPDGTVPDAARRFVMRMLGAEFDSRQPAERGRPSTVTRPFDLHGRYRICGLLGFGGQARTWYGIDQKTGARVAVKELDLGRLQQWKSLQLFEREAEVLERMDHPGVPHYVDSFKQQDGGEITFFMAMEYIEGVSLADEVAAGGGLDLEEVTAVRDALFETLEYIHGFEPPMVHRDIKPSNIIRRPDGRIVLVDFGAVQATAAKSMGGSTVVGTSGYAPIEQFMGKAVPASDLYALGATLVHLLSGRPPTELPTAGNRLQFESVISVPPSWQHGLHALLLPAVEQRPASVAAARAAFDAESPVEPPAPKKSSGGSPLIKVAIVVLAVGAAVAWYFGEQRQKALVDVPNIYDTKPDGALQALFIGNSHTYWGAPRYVAEMVPEGERPLWFEVHAAPGRLLGWHVEEGMEEEISSGRYDVVVFQPQSLEPVTNPDYFGAALARLEAAAKEAGTRSIVWVPWARDPEYDIYGIYPKFGDFEKLTNDLDRRVRTWTGSSEVCPVGKVVYEARQRHPDIQLLSEANGNSVAAAGAYVVGLSLYSCIYEADAKSVTWESGKIPPAEAKKLRAVTSEVLSGDE